jgi:hypothetical protein
LEFGSFVHARSEILGFGTFAEVLEPVELREAVIQLAAGIVEFYKEKSEQHRSHPGIFVGKVKPQESGKAGRGEGRAKHTS